MKLRWVIWFVCLFFVDVAFLCAGDSFVRRVPSDAGGQFEKTIPPDSGDFSHRDGERPSMQTAKEDPDLARRWLLAVGVRKFADTRISPLKYTSEDARAMAAYFKSDGVDESRIKLLVDEEATRGNVMAALDDFKGRIGAEDSFFFFYSSHGAGDAAGETYFIAFDTIGDELKDTGIHMQTLRDVIKGFDCKNVVMMVDTCHSGGAKAMGKQDEKAFEQMVRAAGQKTRVAILTSSRTHEVSVESEKWGHGAFTYYMLEGVSGAADNFPEDGRVSVTELFDHVMVAVPRATNRAQHPSGKFSYNWPAEKESAVGFGRVARRGGDDPGGRYSGAQPPPSAGESGQKWQSVFE